MSESTVSFVYSLQFLFKSTHHWWRYERKCEHSVLYSVRSVGYSNKRRFAYILSQYGQQFKTKL